MKTMTVTNIHVITTAYNHVGREGGTQNRYASALLFKWEGETEYTQGSRRVRSNHANPIFLPKGSGYHWKCLSPGRFSSIEFDTLEALPKEIAALPCRQMGKIHELIDQMEKRSLLKSSSYEMENMRDFYAILYLLAEEQKSHHAATLSDALDAVLSYMAEHMAEAVTNEQLARVLGVSEVYFRKLFTKKYGVSPMRYRNHLRIEKAKDMLLFDFDRQEGIALMLGYHDVYHFGKAFKMATGMTPGEWKKQQETRRKESLSPVLQPDTGEGENFSQSS
ncbi:MAG: AraC family transcriptional regulator [Eubacteriales bacterium]